MSSGMVHATGVLQEGTNKFNAQLPEYNGSHLWVFVGMWGVKDPSAKRQNFDIDNLLTVEGPGCYWCELEWHPSVSEECVRVHQDER